MFASSLRSAARVAAAVLPLATACTLVILSGCQDDGGTSSGGAGGKSGAAKSAGAGKEAGAADKKAAADKVASAAQDASAGKADGKADDKADDKADGKADGKADADGPKSDGSRKPKLDGTSWKLEIKSPVAKDGKPVADSLLFLSGRVTSNVAKAEGFKMSAYQLLEKDNAWSLTAVLTHKTNKTRRLLNGVIKDTNIEGSFQVVDEAGAIQKEETFTGIKTNKRVKSSKKPPTKKRRKKTANK